MYHEGGIDGAGAGGHWERTATAAERIYYEEDASTKLHVFTVLLGNEYTLTNYGLELLKKHVQLTYQGENAQDFDILKLTVAQIGKFICNREYVDKDCSKQLLGPLTADAEYVIARLPEIDREYDANFRALIDSNLPENRRFVPPEKRRYSTLDYQIALTLLTPPTIQSQAAHRDEIDQHQIWHLRANEISILDVEYIVYDHGLSAQLYAVCNREDIATQLSEEFLQMLAADPNFVTNASSLLQSLVAKLPSSKQNAESQMAPTIPTHSIVFDTLDSLIREEQHDKIPSPLIDPSPVISTNIQPPTITADFYLRCAKYFFIAGGIFAILALLTCPLVATVLGISGAIATKVAVVSTGFAMTTLLTGLSIFVLRRNAHPNRERTENTESLSNFASPSSH